MEDLKKYIGKTGRIDQDGWNFSKGNFKVIKIGNFNTLEILHEDKYSSGDYDSRFIIERLDTQSLKG